MVNTGVDGGMNEPGVPVEGCPVESEDEVKAVEDISEAFVRRRAARFNLVFCQRWYAAVVSIPGSAASAVSIHCSLH
jgi:hypothetical protein